jgi:hypothetical protein
MLGLILTECKPQANIGASHLLVDFAFSLSSTDFVEERVGERRFLFAFPFSPLREAIGSYPAMPRKHARK